MRNKAYTLIEILIVVAVVGILAALFLPDFIQDKITAKAIQESTVIHADVEIHFSGTGKADIDPNIVSEICTEIASAKISVHVSCYGINNQDIANALVAAKKRNIEVVVGEDKLQSAGKYDLHAKLSGAGVKVVIKKISALEHNKYIIIDGTDTIVGSYNFSKAAQSEDNPILFVLDNPLFAQEFETDFSQIIQRDTKGQ